MGISPAGVVAIGILVGLISDCTQAIGLTLQRKSHLLEDARCGSVSRSSTSLSHLSHHTPRPAHKRRRWQVGISLYLLANTVGSSVQLTTLPLPVLATLQASGLVFNAVCATVILREPFTRYSFSGTLLILAGAVLIALFGAIPEPAHTLDQLLELLMRRSFAIWMSLQAVVVVLVVTVATLLGRIQSLANRPRIRLARGICYGFLAGTLSAHALLLAKSAVELTIRMVVDRVNQFNNIPSWLILISFVVVTACQLYCLHLGLKLISTSILYPLAFCTYNIIAILDGLIYFHQTRLIPKLSAGLIGLGVAVLLSGVLLLSWRLEEPTAIVPTNVLAPGMGMVEDSAHTSLSDGKSEDAGDDDMDEVDITSPLLQKHKASLPFDEESGHVRSNSGSGTFLYASPLTPKTPGSPRPHRRRSSLLSLSLANHYASARRRSTIESNNIYRDLAADDGGGSPLTRHPPSPLDGLASPFSPLSPLSPFSAHRRQGRTRSFGALLPESAEGASSRTSREGDAEDAEGRHNVGDTPVISHRRHSGPISSLRGWWRGGLGEGYEGVPSEEGREERGSSSGIR